MADTPTLNPYLTPGQTPAKAPAPGAKTARICGIAAIVCALTCVGIPIALILGIVALVKAGKAKALAKSYPETYEMPSSAGMILGIVGLCLPVVMLPFAGIVSAIAIPALLSQRQHARDRALHMQMAQVKARAEAISLELGSRDLNRAPTGEDVIERLMQDPALKSMKNSYAPEDVVLIRGFDPRPGTIALNFDRELSPDGSRFFVILRAAPGRWKGAALQEEKVDVGFRPSLAPPTEIR